MTGRPYGPAPESPGLAALGYLMLACDECGATWAGPTGEACSWCADRARWRREHARTLAIEEPDVRWMAPAEAMHAVRQATLRLADAVAEGVLSPTEAAMWAATWARKIEGVG